MELAFKNLIFTHLPVDGAGPFSSASNCSRSSGITDTLGPDAFNKTNSALAFKAPEDETIDLSSVRSIQLVNTTCISSLYRLDHHLNYEDDQFVWFCRESPFTIWGTDVMSTVQSSSFVRPNVHCMHRACETWPNLKSLTVFIFTLVSVSSRMIRHPWLTERSIALSSLSATGKFTIGSCSQSGREIFLRVHFQTHPAHLIQLSPCESGTECSQVEKWRWMLIQDVFKLKLVNCGVKSWSWLALETSGTLSSI